MSFSMRYEDRPVKKDAIYWIVSFWLTLGVVATHLAMGGLWLIATASQIYDRFRK